MDPSCHRQQKSAFIGLMAFVSGAGRKAYRFSPGPARMMATLNRFASTAALSFSNA